MTSREIRQKYLTFLKSKKHSIIQSASLIPDNDSSTLFTSSGMQPLIPYLMGEKHSDGTRLVNIQKSFRLGDIEEVGDSRHNTFFEMLGNWSLGDYFKKEQLSWFFEFLTKKLNLDPNKFFVSVYSGNKKIGVERDMISVNVWKKVFLEVGIKAKDIDESEKNGMQGGRIFYYGDDKNWWSRSGVPDKMPINEIGGPDSELFYDLGEDLKHHENSKWKNKPCHINCDCGRFIEIGNSVFIEFIKTKKGFKLLPQKNVDFGGGLERITMIAQGKNNVFETDLFINILNKIEQLSDKKKYKDNVKAFETIADHIKGAVFIMSDDKKIVPSNVDQGYIVRRLIRRAIRFGRILGIKSHKNKWVKEIAKIIVNDYAEFYPELKQNISFVIKELDKEEIKFAKTLENGLKQFNRYKSKLNIDKIIAGKDAFDLYQSYGFPIEMTEELAEENGIFVDKDDFKNEMKKHQDLSRTASVGKFKGGLADVGDKTKKLHTVAHLLLESLRRILGNDVYQKGCNITAERLRFDFSYSEKMTDEQKIKVEKIVNDIIAKNLPINCSEMSLEKAKKINAMGIFDSKYGKNVKVYTIGDEKTEIFSKEICGGPHVERTGKLGKFKIKKEQSSSAGIRRIKAILIDSDL